MTIKPKTRKRIMRRFQIEEISGVDIPAQSGALATIAKRDDSNTFAKSCTPLVIAKFGNDGVSYTHLRKDDNMDEPTLERVLAALDALNSKITAIENEFASGRKKTRMDPDERAFRDQLDDDASEDVKAAVDKFQRGGRSLKQAVAMASRRVVAGTLAKSNTTNFAKHVDKLRTENPRLSRQEAMRKARRENPAAFALAYR